MNGIRFFFRHIMTPKIKNQTIKMVWQFVLFVRQLSHSYGVAPQQSSSPLRQYDEFGNFNLFHNLSY